MRFLFWFVIVMAVFDLVGLVASIIAKRWFRVAVFILIGLLMAFCLAHYVYFPTIFQI